MGCTQSTKVIPLLSPVTLRSNYTTHLQCAYAVSSDMIQQAYKIGYDDAMSIFSKNQFYSYFSDSQKYYNDGYEDGEKMIGIEEQSHFSKTYAQELYDSFYGYKIINSLHNNMQQPIQVTKKNIK